MIHSFSLLVNQTFALVPRLAAPYVSARFAEVALRDEGGEVGFAVAFCCGALAALADGVGVVVGEGLALFARVEAEDASCVLCCGLLSEA